MRGLATFGTVLLIDHIPKSAPGANLAHVRAHGSAFKYNLVRSAISAVRADGGAITLRHTKANFGPMSSPTYAAFVCESDAVRLETVAVDDARLAGADYHLTAAETVLFALRDRGTSGATPQEIADELGKSEKTVTNYLTTLNKEGRVQTCGGSRWRVPNPNTHRDGNGKESEGSLDDEL